jgi:hypothetical protein
MLLELPVIRVQVQLDRIKVGLPPRRRYEPVILREVAELHVTADGAVGVAADGTECLDVHNGHHPHTRDAKRRNGISNMTTGDFAALRARYGPHLTDGIAAESVLLDYAPGLAGRAMPEELALVGAPPVAGAAEGGVIPAADRPPTRLALTGVHIAKPCVPFAQFCLRREDFDVDDDIQQALEHLDGGARGYKMAAAAPGVIRPGDVLAVILPD